MMLPYFSSTLTVKSSIRRISGSSVSSTAETYSVSFEGSWLKLPEMRTASPSVYPDKPTRHLPNYQNGYRQRVAGQSKYKNPHGKAYGKSYSYLSAGNLLSTCRTRHTGRVKLPLSHAVRPLSLISACGCQNSL